MKDKSESQVLGETKIAAGLIPGLRLARNNVGSAMINGRKVMFGLGVGTPDLCGFYSIVITQDMVGKRVAVATGIECKSEHGKLSEDQEKVGTLLKNFGAIWGCVNDSAQLKPLIANYTFPVAKKAKDHSSE